MNKWTLRDWLLVLTVTGVIPGLLLFLLLACKALAALGDQP